MTKRTLKEHNHDVHEFLRKCEEENPDQFENVCKKYPVLSSRHWRNIASREYSGGLLSSDEPGYEED